jgi:IMP dehydrogenase
MCGSLFAGTDEAPGKVISRNGVFYKRYDASTSSAAKKLQLEKDNNDRKPQFNLQVEGVESYVKYKGSVTAILEQLCAGIRSGISYSGAFNVKELQERAQFVRITPAGLRESYPHDVEVI